MTKALIALIAVPVSVLIIIPLLVPAALLFQLGKWTGNDILMRYGFNLAYSLDQLGNTMWLGDPDETISSRTGRALLSGNPRWWVIPFGKLVDSLALLFDDPNHVRKSVEKDEDQSKELDPWFRS